MALVGDRVLQEIISNFPSKFSWVFAYGSAVFAQKYQQPGKMLDLIFVVNDPVKWHRENLKKNRRHYSGIGYLGPHFITAVQEKMACGVYYNPYCQVNGRTIKYGVTSTESLARDLNSWNHLYLAGRLHKPVLDVFPLDNLVLSSALKRNRNLALIAALLQSEGIITKYQLFYKIAQLSYEGDTRMRYAENPQKTRNIVIPLMEEFDKIYMPLIEELDTAVELPDDLIAQDVSPMTRYKHLIKMPLHVQKRIAASCNRSIRHNDIEDILLDLAFSHNLETHISNAIAGVVRDSSIWQTVQGIFTAGVIRSTKYAIDKLSKGFQKKEEPAQIDAPPKMVEGPPETKTISYVVPTEKITKVSSNDSMPSSHQDTINMGETASHFKGIPHEQQMGSSSTKIVRPIIKHISLTPKVSNVIDNKSTNASSNLIKEHTIVKVKTIIDEETDDVKVKKSVHEKNSK